MPIYPPGKTAEDIEKVYQKAHKETKIIYPKKTNLFSPKLKNLNYVSSNKGHLANNFLIRIIDFFLGLWNGFLNFFEELFLKLYPKKDTIYGTEKDTYITGKLTFAKRSDSTMPIHHMPVTLWARTWLGGWRKFSEGETDKEGVFKLYFDFLESRKFRYRKFYFQIYQTSHIFFDQVSKEALPQNEVFESFKISKSEFTGMGYDLNNIQLFYWEYRDDVPLPRVVIKDHDEDAPEYYSKGRNIAIEAQFIPVELTKDEHIAKIAINPDLLSIPKIQSDYPLNLTVAMEDELPYSTRCDYWFGRRMMNGMNCATFQEDTHEKGTYWVRYFGSCNYSINNEYAFPTAETQYKLAENGLPIPIKIKITGPTNSFNHDPFQVKEFKPDDGAMWEHAKRVVRVSGGLSTELDDHFAGTHLNTEQYAIAVRRNLRRSPIAELLLPHVKEVALINHSADTILIGPGYIPKASALTAEGIIERVKDMTGVLDWKNWEPMSPISEAHTYAKAECLFWEVVNEFVEDFFKEYETQIIEEWYEIYCFSETLVANSVPLFHSNINTATLSENELNLHNDRVSYYHERYRLDPSLERDKIDGITKTISPITKNAKEPDKGDLAHLKSACKYVIMMATFMHAWVNEHQYEDIGEVLYSSLGLRFSDAEEGIFQPEDHYAIAPDLTRATQMMWFSNLLSRTEYGFITRNEEHDIHPDFIKVLEKRRKEFEALNVNIDNIESRTNI